MIVVIVVLVVLAVVFVGAAVPILRRLRYLPLHRYAVATRRWGLPAPNQTREEFLLRRTRIVRGGQTVPPWSWLYDIHEYDYVTIPTGTVGLVKAKIGANAPAGRRLSRYVDCDRFQNVTKFLKGDCEQGVQPELLRGGEAYAIDPQVFDVYTVDTLPADFPAKPDDLRLVAIDAEDVGVVVVTDAPPPDDLRVPAPTVKGHNNFQKPWEFLWNGGRSGPQTDVLPGGATYAINPLFARVVHIPTRELTLTWGTKSVKEDRYDSELGPLKVIIQGFELEVELTQTLSIPPYAAPFLVKRFGEDAYGDVGVQKSTAVKRFVGRVLGEKVRGYFNERASGGEIDRFLHELAEMRGKLRVQITQALAEVQVDARETTIGEIRFASDELNKEYREYVRLQQRFRQLEQELLNQHVTNNIERVQLEVHKEKLAAKLEVLIDLMGPDHVKRMEAERIRAGATHAPIILTGGMPAAVPVGPSQPSERIAIPVFDAAEGLDVFDISPGLLSPDERTETGAPE
ncbi:SPFH domain / Band 7 family protein [Lentzea waywayandensis]|uniref:SPFH domain / Band 7 family protein n=1 Tax=Lentzea waywayandensis TaxID=84724 RepID=A0A1I6F4V5_9PSEU|nr:SPFH domain-containing protein [Lentzea waywayandensis]SFR24777.1 SPFH domain / Band 7 family protein [Lentzea waywayandensis]